MPWSEPRARAANTDKAGPSKFIVELLVVSPRGRSLLQNELRMPDIKRPVSEWSEISRILLQNFS